MKGLTLRFDEKSSNAIEAIKNKYDLEKTSQAVRKALAIATETTSQALENKSIDKLTEEIQALRKEIEKLEFMIMQGKK